MGPLNLIEHRVERFLREPPSVRNAAGVIVVATAAVVVGAGVLISVIDNEEYPNVGIGLWWALQTVTTVGYGDVSPSHFGGRLVGAVVMLEGTARVQEEVSDRERMEQRFDELERKLDLLATARDEPGSRT